MTDPTSKSNSGDAGDPRDPLVNGLRSEPSRSPAIGLTLNGILGNSDFPDCKRLYFTKELDYFIEFPVADIIYGPIPSSKAVPSGIETTQITLRKGADIDYTHAMKSHPPDEFDLDFRLGSCKFSRFGDAGGAANEDDTETYEGGPCDTQDQCWTQGWFTCTCGSMSCQTCYDTQCDIPTCGGDWTCGQPTCSHPCPTDDQTCSPSCIETACVGNC